MTKTSLPGSRERSGTEARPFRAEWFTTDYPLPDNSRLPLRQDILDRTHCDVCRRTKADGAHLRWFTSSTVVCERPTCKAEMLEGWRETCRRVAEEARAREEEGW